MTRVAEIELRADQLACELLAPAEVLAERYGPQPPDTFQITQDLVGIYGLPPFEASLYGERWRKAHGGVTPISWLRGR
jgi:hypothetical protein